MSSISTGIINQLKLVMISRPSIGQLPWWLPEPERRADFEISRNFGSGITIRYPTFREIVII
jgi:hypothetical protein